MKLNVKQGNSVMVSTHIGRGEERRMLFIAPWGCSLSTPKPAPRNADLSPRAYSIEVSGEVERLIRAAVKDGHKGLLERIDFSGMISSPTFGQLPDTEENRLAVRARDVQGWPYEKMTGASPDELRKMSETKYVAPKGK